MGPEAQYRLLEAVAERAGIVLVGAHDPRVLKPQNRIEPLPPFLGDVEGIEAYAVLAGRGAVVPRQVEIPYGEGWEETVAGRASLDASTWSRMELEIEEISLELTDALWEARLRALLSRI